MNKLMTLCVLLAMAGQAEAHPSHSVLPVHLVEHLLLWGAFLVLALLLAGPAKRLISRFRK